MTTKDDLWEAQSTSLRIPSEIVSQRFDLSGITNDSLEFQADEGFIQALNTLGITLVVSREYEHLVLALGESNEKLKQTFVSLPHPSGVVADRENDALYIAGTRNPNQIWEFKPTQTQLKRKGVESRNDIDTVLMPSRVKYFPGSYYFHDLGLIGGQLYANSVGQNAICKIDWTLGTTDELVWWPKSIEDTSRVPDTSLNYLQLNSIAAGKTLQDSYFSASSDRIRDTQPGNIKFPVDKTGVIFSGKTREVYGTGLTRPHSARMYEGEIWVDNSGYGELGKIESGKFLPMHKLTGWTRGLCFVKNIAFVGVSRVLPRFSAYAPGLDATKALECGIYAIDMKSNSILGKIIWPYGNQIFAIDYFNKENASGFLYENMESENTEKTLSAFSTYTV